MASSLPGAQSRLIARIVATRDHGTSAGTASSRVSKNSSSRSCRQSARPSSAGPSCRVRSSRTKVDEPQPLEEIIGDKGYHSNQSMVDLEAVGIRSYIAEPDRG